MFLIQGFFTYKLFILNKRLPVKKVINYKDIIQEKEELMYQNTFLIDEEDKTGHKYGALMLFFDIPKWESDVLSLIDEEDIYKEEGLEHDSHVTLLYGLHKDVKLEDLKDSVNRVLRDKRVFIIHGWEGNSNKNWFPWIKKELNEKEFDVHVLTMPTPDNPIIKDWVNTLKENISNPDENTYFIGHSMGVQTIFRYLETLDKNTKIGGIITVAGFFNLPYLETKEEKNIARPWLETSIDTNKIKEMTNNIVSIFSDNDPDVSLDETKVFKKKLGSKVIIQKNKEHFTDDKIPIVIDELLKISNNTKNNIKVKSTKITHFSGEEYDVVKFDIESDLLHKINKELVKFPHTSDFPDYIPHMTISYVKKGTGKKYNRKLKNPITLKGTKIVYSHPNGKEDSWNLGDKDIIKEETREEVQQWLKNKWNSEDFINELFPHGDEEQYKEYFSDDLKYLYLRNNNLSNLPESIGNLTNLEYLDLRNNNLSNLPESIGNLTNLNTLDLDNNNLSDLSESIGNLTNLEKLYLQHNNLSKQEQDKIQKLLPNTLIYSLNEQNINEYEIIKEDIEQNQEVKLQIINDDQGMLVNILLDNHKVGHMGLETRDYKTYIITDTLIDTKYKKYYKPSVFELVRQKPNITILVKSKKDIYDSLMKDLSNDIDIKKTEEDGIYLYWMSKKKGVLNESELLLEGRIEDSKKKWVDSGKVMDSWFKFYSEMDPSNNQKYLDWLLDTHYKDFSNPKMNPSDEHVIDLPQYVEYFHKNNVRFKDRDINKYKTFKQFTDTVDEVQRTPSKTELRKIIKQQSTILLNDNKYFVVIPKTHQSSCYYGAGTRWCTTAKDPAQFNAAVRKGHFLYIIDKSKEQFIPHEKTTGSVGAGTGDPLSKLAILIPKNDTKIEITDSTDKLSNTQNYFNNNPLVVEVLHKNNLLTFRQRKKYGLISKEELDKLYKEFAKQGSLGGRISKILQSGINPEDIFTEDEIKTFNGKIEFMTEDDLYRESGIKITVSQENWRGYYSGLDDDSNWMLDESESYDGFREEFDDDELNYIHYYLNEDSKDKIKELMKLLGKEKLIKDISDENTIYDFFKGLPNGEEKIVDILWELNSHNGGNLRDKISQEYENEKNFDSSDVYDGKEMFLPYDKLIQVLIDKPEVESLLGLEDAELNGEIDLHSVRKVASRNFTDEQINSISTEMDGVTDSYIDEITESPEFMENFKKFNDLIKQLGFKESSAYNKKYILPLLNRGIQFEITDVDYSKGLVSINIIKGIKQKDGTFKRGESTKHKIPIDELGTFVTTGHLFNEQKTINYNDIIQDNKLIKEETAEDTKEYINLKWKIEKDFLELVNNLEKKTYPGFPNNIFYIHKNTKKAYMENNKENNLIYIDNKLFWKKLQSKYGNDRLLIQILNELIREHLDLWNIRGIDPFVDLNYYSKPEQTIKYKDIFQEGFIKYGNIIQESRLSSLFGNIGIEKFFKKLSKGLNINIDPKNYIGEGLFGNVYKIDDNRLLKLTTDTIESMAVNKLIRRKLDNVIDYYKIFKLQSKEIKGELHVIIMENVDFNEKLNEKYISELSEVLHGLPNELSMEMTGKPSNEMDWLDFGDYVRDKSKKKDVILTEVSKLIKKSGNKMAIDMFDFMFNLYSELNKYNLNFIDLHEGNMGLRNGRLVGFDMSAYGGLEVKRELKIDEDLQYSSVDDVTKDKFKIGSSIGEQQLNELGDPGKIYNWDRIREDSKSSSIFYRFINKYGTEYRVWFDWSGEEVDGVDTDVYSRNFQTLKGGFDETGEGDVLNVIRTVTDITRDFIEKFNPDEIRINHIVSDKEEKKGLSTLNVDTVSKRAKINKVFLEKIIPNDYGYFLIGSTSHIKKKDITDESLTVNGETILYENIEQEIDGISPDNYQRRPIYHYLREETKEQAKDYLKKKWAVEGELIKILDQLEKEYPLSDPDVILYIYNDEIYFYYREKDNYLIVGKSDIWRKLMRQNNINRDELKQIFKDILPEYLNITPKEVNFEGLTEETLDISDKNTILYENITMVKDHGHSHGQLVHEQQNKQPFFTDMIHVVNRIMKYIYSNTEYWGQSQSGVEGIVKPITPLDDKTWSNYNFINTNHTTINKIVIPKMEELFKTGNYKLEGCLNFPIPNRNKLTKDFKEDEYNPNKCFFNLMWLMKEELFGLNSDIKDDIIDVINRTRGKGNRLEDYLVKSLNDSYLTDDAIIAGGPGSKVDFTGTDITFTLNGVKKEVQVKSITSIKHGYGLYELKSSGLGNRKYEQDLLIFSKEIVKDKEYEFYIFENPGDKLKPSDGGYYTIPEQYLKYGLKYSDKGVQIKKINESVIQYKDAIQEGSYTNKFNFEIGKQYRYDELPKQIQDDINEQLYMWEVSETNNDYNYEFKLISIDRLYLYIKKEVMPVTTETTVEEYINQPYIKELAKEIQERGLDYPSVGVEGNHRAAAHLLLGKDLPYLEFIPKTGVKPFRKINESVIQYKDIIKEEQLSGQEYLNIKWEIEDDFIEMLSKLKKKPHKNYLDDIFWIDRDNNVIIRYNSHDKEINVDFYKWWRPLTKKYPMIEEDELHSIVKIIIQEHLMSVKDFNEYHDLRNVSNFFKSNLNEEMGYTYTSAVDPNNSAIEFSYSLLGKTPSYRYDDNEMPKEWIAEDSIKEETKEEAQQYLEKKWKIEDEFVKILDTLEKRTIGKNKIIWIDKRNYTYINYNKEQNMVQLDTFNLIQNVIGDLYQFPDLNLNNNELRQIFKDIIGEHLNLFGVELYQAGLPSLSFDNFTEQKIINYNDLLKEEYAPPQLVSVKLQMHNKDGIGIGEIYSNDDSTLTIIDREYPELDSYQAETGQLSGKERVKEIIHDNGRYYDENSSDDIVREEEKE